MPAKINMFLSNGNPPPHFLKQNMSSLGSNPSIAAPKAPSALNASMLSRVHNVRPGCGSCGRH
jgi:hypothetical protein